MNDVESAVIDFIQGTTNVPVVLITSGGTTGETILFVTLLNNLNH